MENSPVMHFLGKAAWLLTALAAIHVGLMAIFEVDSFSYLPVSMEFLVRPIHILYLVAGVYSLVMLFMHCRCCE